MVLASGRDCELLCGTFFRSTLGNRLAWHPLRDGHGGDLEFACGRSDRPDACRGGGADRGGRKGSDARFPALRRRPSVVGRGGENAAATEGAALLSGYCPILFTFLPCFEQAGLECGAGAERHRARAAEDPPAAVVCVCVTLDPNPERRCSPH